MIITAAPYGPMWLPSDYPEDIPVTWDEQVQKAVDCFNAGATVLHVHVRDPKTGHISKNFDEYSAQIGRPREAVPGMVLQIGGSISFTPKGDGAAQWQGTTPSHAGRDRPKPDQVTVAVGSSLYDLTSVMTIGDVEGTHMADPKVIWQYSQMVADATPEFYIEHLKRLREHGIQPFFALGRVHNLEIVERGEDPVGNPDRCRRAGNPEMTALLRSMILDPARMARGHVTSRDEASAAAGIAVAGLASLVPLAVVERLTPPTVLAEE